MTQYLLTVHSPAERDEFGNYGSKEQGSKACRGNVGLRPFDGLA